MPWFIFGFIFLQPISVYAEISDKSPPFGLGGLLLTFLIQALIFFFLMKASKKWPKLIFGISQILSCFAVFQLGLFIQDQFADHVNLAQYYRELELSIFIVHLAAMLSIFALPSILFSLVAIRLFRRLRLRS